MKFIRPSFVLIFFFVLGGAMFKSMAPTDCGTILNDDSIFVLTGDARRIPFAMKIARMRPDTDLFIIGAGAEPSAVAAARARIESDSKSTYQNAVAIRKIVTRSGLDRIVVVTTEDHMNRARYLIKQELPTVEVVACPVRLTDMPAMKRLERWGVEYVKYIVTMFGIKES